MTKRERVLRALEFRDDTVILVESDCGLEEPRDKGGIDNGVAPRGREKP